MVTGSSEINYCHLNKGVANVYRRRTQVDDQTVFVEVHPIPIPGHGRNNRFSLAVFQLVWVAI
jgi:hypothetical protein